ncbi:anti-sigma factor [Paenibacillus sp. F411]|nr:MULTISPECIES: anti-sigma factor [Paenibacillus]MBO2943167.1 anti-sigma factor [Paenibacillus sp. F411]
MKCEEARELMEIVWDLPDNDLRVYRLKQHILTCSSCAMEYQSWEESLEMVQELKFEPSLASAEIMNRNVMDRIYRDFPWLVEENGPEKASGRIFRRRLSLWIAGFTALFVSSLLIFAFRGNIQKQAVEEIPSTGILPTGIAGGSDASGNSIHYDIPGPGSGIIDPLVAGIDPSQPQYWMILSIIGVSLAIYFLLRLNRAVRR